MYTCGDTPGEGCTFGDCPGEGVARDEGCILGDSVISEVVEEILALVFGEPVDIGGEEGMYRVRGKLKGAL